MSSQRVQSQKISGKLIIISFLVIALTVWFGGRYIFHQISKHFIFANTSPERIFSFYILDDYSNRYPDSDDYAEKAIPSEVTRLRGIEIMHLKDPAYNTAYLHFSASKVFIEEMIKKQPAYYKPYHPIECLDFLTNSQSQFIQDYPEEFDWWRPAEVKLPVCYQARVGNDNSFPKYLLIDPDRNEVYLYRTFNP